MGNTDSHSAPEHVPHAPAGRAAPATYPAYSGAAPGAGFRAFADSYADVDVLQADLRRSGLESSNLLLGIDFTKSNEWTGKATFGGKCLHALSPASAAAGGAILEGSSMNPYEQVIALIGRTLEVFDDDNMIPAYGFGDGSTHDSAVFSFKPRDEACAGFTEVLALYRAMAPRVKLAGPTSFGPLIRQACAVVQASGQYHILLIIADGQVTRSSDLPPGEVSPQEADTIDAIVAATALPLSIVMVGVGDGPWDTMQAFDDLLPARAFDNFQFVPYADTLRRAQAAAAARGIRDTAAFLRCVEATFALHALMEIPEQYKAINRLRLMGPAAAARARVGPVRRLDPPPLPATHSMSAMPVPMPPSAPPAAAPAGPSWTCTACTLQNPLTAAACAMCHTPRAPISARGAPAPAPAPAPMARGPSDNARRELEALREERTCSVCLEKPKNTAFQCGHQTCETCAPVLRKCPICRADITSRIRLYS